MQQFILEGQLEVIYDEDGREYEEFVELEKEESHAEDSSSEF